MSTERLNRLSLLYVHPQVTITSDEAIDDFAKAPRRQAFKIYPPGTHGQFYWKNSECVGLVLLLFSLRTINVDDRSEVYHSLNL
jgi:hypothetical protein